jgi:probable HAF family extracellular repeat protein
MIPGRRRTLRSLLPVVLLVLTSGAMLVVVCNSVNLGTLGGDESIAAGLNPAEQVVGGAETADGHWHAFLWQDGEISDLGTLGGDQSEAHAISRGFDPLIVGTSEMPHPNYPVTVERAFLWRGGVMTELGTLGGDNSEAWAVSDTGLVVGSAQTADEEWHAFLWEEGVMTDLGTLGGHESCALGVNDAGEVVGWSMAPGESDDPNDVYWLPVQRRAFLWTAEGGMTDLGTLGGRNSAACAVAQDGYVTGWSDTSGPDPNAPWDPNAAAERHVFLWNPDEGMQDLGTLGGPVAEAWGIGPTGVAGYSVDANEAVGGFWTDTSGELRSLNQPLGGSGPVFVTGIDGSSCVVGSATTGEGEEHAFLRRFVDR